MWMTEYITEVKRQMIEVHGFKVGSNGCPEGVPDGTYPMTIEGKVDRVRIEDGIIKCCNFEKENK